MTFLEAEETSGILIKGPLKCSQCQNKMDADEFPLSYDQVDKDDSSLWYEITIGGNVIGYISCYKNKNECDIYSYEIKKSEHGKGIGTEALKAFMSKMRGRGIKSFRLVPMDGEGRLKKFYNKIGFKETSTEAYDGIKYMLSK
jgi:RimJ/RimL family protein N-acetyltransferase